MKRRACWQVRVAATCSCEALCFTVQTAKYPLHLNQTRSHTLLALNCAAKAPRYHRFEAGRQRNRSSLLQVTWKVDLSSVRFANFPPGSRPPRWRPACRQSQHFSVRRWTATTLSRRVPLFEVPHELCLRLHHATCQRKRPTISHLSRLDDVGNFGRSTIHVRARAILFCRRVQGSDASGARNI